MIIAKIVGGLGNQIAIYAFGFYLSKKFNTQLKLDLSAYKTYRLHDYSLHHFTLDANIASPAEIEAAKNKGHIVETSSKYDSEILSKIQDGCYLEGYWADYRYAEPIIEDLKSSFLLSSSLTTESELLLQKIKQEKSVSLHIRRGDYVTNPNCVVLPITFYEDAINRILSIEPASYFFIFSDDIEWVKNNLHISAPKIWVDFNDSSRNFMDFELIRNCKHHINANSTFSFWAAYLSYRNGEVLAPQQYFQPNDPYLVSIYTRVSQPIWPKYWESLPIRINRQRNVDFPDLPGGECTSTKPICIVVTGLYETLTTQGKIFLEPNAPIGADLLKPWCELYRYGQKNGLHFFTPDQLNSFDEVDAVIFLDRPTSENFSANALLNLPIPKYLYLYECEMIYPANWDKNYHSLFDRIYTWNDDWIDNIRYHKICFAIEPTPAFDFEVLKTAFEQRKLCTMIAGGKISQHPNELYSERIKAIQWFEANTKENFDLYGQGWPEQVFKTYRGATQDKLLTLGKYRFSICFENATNYSGYITEKILDCFLAGVIPIYWGAPNITDWIPEECFIDFKKFANWESIYEYITEMPQEIYASYLNSINNFLESPKSYPFSIDAFICNLTGPLARDIKIKRNEQPRLSVVIPTYNHGQYIKTAIQSVINQNIENIEILVIDNASTDQTKSIVEDTFPSVRYVRNNKNIGAAPNWGTAAAIASGQALIFLSSDDFLLEGHLERSLNALDQHPNAGLIYCPVICVNENNQPTKVLIHPGHPNVDYCGGRNEALDLLAFDCYITPSAAVIRRTAYDIVGGFRPKIRAAIDLDLWIRIAENGFDFLFFRLPSVCYRYHDGQDTNRAIESGDMLLDHIDIIERFIKIHGLASLSNRHQKILEILQWRLTYQRGNSDLNILSRGIDIFQKILTFQTI